MGYKAKVRIQRHQPQGRAPPLWKKHTKGEVLRHITFAVTRAPVLWQALHADATRTLYLPRQPPKMRRAHQVSRSRWQSQFGNKVGRYLNDRRVSESHIIWIRKQQRLSLDPTLNEVA